MDTQNFKNNGHNKYPVSTETLELLQQQTKLVAELYRIVGVDDVILKDSTAAEAGIIVRAGEIMPLLGAPAAYITVREEAESVTFDGETIENARVRRWAEYTSTSYGANSKLAYSVSIRAAGFRTLKEIYDRVIENRKHCSPKGTISDWYGTMSAANMPYGWVPCGKMYFSSASAREVQKTAWSNKYPEGITFSTDNAKEGLPGLRIVSVTANGTTMQVPDLTDRFIVAAGNNYDCGATGGENFHTLTVEEMPSHSHTLDSVVKSTSGTEAVGDSGSGARAFNEGTQERIYGSGATGNSNAHENRPPYYALYKIMKVI